MKTAISLVIVGAVLISIGSTILISGIALIGPGRHGPIDDTYVRSCYPNVTHGTEGIMLVQKLQTDEAIGYLKFDLSGLPVSVKSATLHLNYYSYEPGFDMELWSVKNDAWNEETLTWNTRPTETSKLGSVYISKERTSTWIEFDVTSFINQELRGDRKASFAIGVPYFTDTMKYTYIRTKEKGEYYSPYLTYEEGTELNTPPVASFTYSPAEPKVGEIVDFTDMSIDPDGSITSWKWTYTFSIDSTSIMPIIFSIDQCPSFTFQQPRTYNVRLEVTDDDGEVGRTSRNITVSEAEEEEPIATFTYSPTYPNVNESIEFDASNSFGGSGSITSYHWNFGDGTTGEGMIVTHSYSNKGIYMVNLTIQTDTGLGDSTYLSVQVEEVSADGMIERTLLGWILVVLGIPMVTLGALLSVVKPRRGR